MRFLAIYLTKLKKKTIKNLQKKKEKEKKAIKTKTPSFQNFLIKFSLMQQQEQKITSPN